MTLLPRGYTSLRPSFPSPSSLKCTTFTTACLTKVPKLAAYSPPCLTQPNPTPKNENLPQACVMIGSVVFKLAMSLAPGTTAERMCFWASAGGSTCFFALSLGLPLRGVQLALLGYEVCVGIYLNAMGMMRSKYIPQEVGFFVGVERVDRGACRLLVFSHIDR